MGCLPIWTLGASGNYLAQHSEYYLAAKVQDKQALLAGEAKEAADALVGTGVNVGDTGHL